MATEVTLPGTTILGELRVTGTKPEYARSELQQETLAKYVISPTDWRVHDAPQTVLPGTAATDDLAISGATFGTDVLYITAGDQKNNTSLNTRYARCFVTLPPEYVSGETVQIRASAGMATTVASAAATIDFEVYLSNREAAKTGSDLCTTAAQSINSTTFADKDFNLTATSLVPGSVLDIRMAVGVNDTATGTAVDATVGEVVLLCDIKG